VVEDKINRWSGLDLSEKLTETIGHDRQDTRPSPARFDRDDYPKARKDATSVFSKKPSDDRRNKPDDRAPKTELKFSANCSLCGREAKLNFAPDPTRPVFCDDCFVKVKEERRKKKDDRVINLPKIDEAVAAPLPTKAKPISLGEALSRPPVSFKAAARPPAETKETPARTPREETKREEKNIKESKNVGLSEPGKDQSHSKLEWYEEAKQALESAKLSSNQSLPAKDEDDNTAPNKLGPGEIIKLD
jgi:CxxC-x17-CxxC domain-containing protein